MTIFALSTGRGPSGIAIVRVSGPDASATLRQLTVAPPGPPRQAITARITAPGSDETIDQGLVLWFPGPHSFTGEDVAEFHVHGGRAVVAALIDALAGLPGLRPAEPGEFTRRAFENGKLDLTQVEGLADLINAETAAQRRQALHQLDGALGALYDDWRERSSRALAHFEAAIDFPDENLPDGVHDAALHNILEIRSSILQHLDDNQRGERLRDGIYVTIVGAPNVGKSSLLNLLVRREAAIVSAVAGTTRDVIEVHLDLAGYPAIVADTAGLRDTGDEIETEGVRRALDRAAKADLKLALFDAAAWPDLDEGTRRLVDDETIVLINKVDLNPMPEDAQVEGRPALTVSVTEGLGMEAFLFALEESVAARLDQDGALSLTRARHRAGLEDCAAALGRALDKAGEADAAPELIAEDVRLAVRALGRITGRVDVEDILDIVFLDFCIGK